MHIERDKEFDLLYISLGDGAREGDVEQTKEVSPGVYFDLDPEGKILGIEIANTKEALGIPVSDLRLSGELLGVKEAAELAGKDRGNFIRDLVRKPGFPEPVAQLASGKVWLSKDVEEYLRKRDSAARAHVHAQEQVADTPTEDASYSDSGDYIYEGGGEEGEASETDADQGYYPNREFPDHQCYSDRSDYEEESESA